MRENKRQCGAYNIVQSKQRIHVIHTHISRRSASSFLSTSCVSRVLWKCTRCAKTRLLLCDEMNAIWWIHWIWNGGMRPTRNNILLAQKRATSTATAAAFLRRKRAKMETRGDSCLARLRCRRGCQGPASISIALLCLSAQQMDLKYLIFFYVMENMSASSFVVCWASARAKIFSSFHSRLQFYIYRTRAYITHHTFMHVLRISVSFDDAKRHEPRKVKVYWDAKLLLQPWQTNEHMCVPCAV